MAVIALSLGPWAAARAEAACTGGSPTWTSSPDQASVATCVASARDGDTINVSAGSATWSEVTISGKALKLIGAGSSSVTINGGSPVRLTNSGSRISGFYFNLGSGGSGIVIEGSLGWRIDHNRVTRPAADTFVLAYGQGGRPVEGLIDNNDITYGRVVYYGEDKTANGGGSGRWVEPLAIGSAKAIYIEDNTIRWLDGSSSGYLNHLDGNYGCRYVARFNNVIGGRFEAHALQGNDERGCRLWEIYNNTITNPSTPGYRPFLIRAGTGMIFHNTSDGRYLSNAIDLDNPRTAQPDVIAQTSKIGACDGASYADGNQSGGEGYPCRDQIGRSTDAFRWGYSSPAPAQEFYPAYIWRNTMPAGEIPVRLNCIGSTEQCTRQSSKHIVLNRDYFTYNSAFNGTSGVGEGPIAGRPSTCTVGVGYWATDQGTWNSRTSGPDGLLYRCSSPNTWTVNYTPFTYPHPLQNGTSTTAPPPAAPTNLRIIR